MSGDFLETSRPVLAWVLRTTWEASLIALLVLAAQWLLRGRVSARWRYNLWLLVVARLVLPAVPGHRASPFNFVQLPAAAGQRATPQRVVTPSRHAPLRAMPVTPLPAVPAPVPERRPADQLYLASDHPRLVEPRLSGEALQAAGSEVASRTQAPLSVIAGVVKDTSGAVLPGVTVEAASPALIEKVRTAVTDGAGRYNIVDLRPGTYVVTFSLVGFKTIKREGITLTAGFTAPVNADLEVGTVEETITVSGSSPLVDTQNVRQQTVVSTEVLAALPTSSKSISDKGELDVPEGGKPFTVYVLDTKSGYAARKTVDSGDTKELSFSSPDFKLLQRICVH